MRLFRRRAKLHTVRLEWKQKQKKQNPLGTKAITLELHAFSMELQMIKTNVLDGRFSVHQGEAVGQ